MALDIKRVFESFSTGDDALDGIQRRTEEAFGGVLDNLSAGIADNVILSDITLAPTPATFEHSLGRIPIGAIVIVADVTTSLIVDLSESNSSEISLAGVAAVVTVLVF